MRQASDAHEVLGAGSAGEALEALEGGRVDGLVSDLGLPDQDDYRLMRTLRERPADRGGTVPAVAVTGFARVEDRRRARLAVFQTHVSKPVEPLELAVVVANLVGRAARAGDPGNAPMAKPGKAMKLRQEGMEGCRVLPCNRW